MCTCDCNFDGSSSAKSSGYSPQNDSRNYYQNQKSWKPDHAVALGSVAWSQQPAGGRPGHVWA